MDYDPGELFAPVAKFTSFRVLVALAAANGWTLRQFDVETAFLYADLEEEVYVRPPKGFEEYDEEGNALVWLLHKYCMMKILCGELQSLIPDCRVEGYLRVSDCGL